VNLSLTNQADQRESDHDLSRSRHVCIRRIRRSRQGFEHEVAIDTASGVRHRPVEAECFRSRRPVDGTSAGKWAAPSGDSFSRLRASAKRPRSRAPSRHRRAR